MSSWCRPNFLHILAYCKLRVYPGAIVLLRLLFVHKFTFKNVLDVAIFVLLTCRKCIKKTLLVCLPAGNVCVCLRDRVRENKREKEHHLIPPNGRYNSGFDAV